MGILCYTKVFTSIITIIIYPVKCIRPISPNSIKLYILKIIRNIIIPLIYHTVNNTFTWFINIFCFNCYTISFRIRYYTLRCCKYIVITPLNIYTSTTVIPFIPFLPIIVISTINIYNTSIKVFISIIRMALFCV